MNGVLSTERAEEIAARQDEKEKAIKSASADGQQDESEEKAAALIQVRGRASNTDDRIELTVFFSYSATIAGTEKGDS